MGITEFLLARFDEDEKLANDAGAGAWQTADNGLGQQLRIVGDNFEIYDEAGHNEAQAEHIARHNPARILREVEAKRAILAEHRQVSGFEGTGDFATGCETCHGDPTSGETEGRGLCGTIHALAAAYTDHADYDASLRP
jgi:hypothetical protein